MNDTSIKNGSSAGKTLRPLSHGALNRCFGCGQQNRTGLRLSFSVDDEGTVSSKVKLASRFEGPPRHAHGGIIATLLDEAMSKANRARGAIAMTRSMEIEYLRPVPLHRPLHLEGVVAQIEGRKHWCEATLRDEQGRDLARCKGLFIALDEETIAAFRKPEVTPAAGTV